ncbi:MAG: glycerol kinase GlpK [Clostridiales bacterium]|jgi:glycerol kinase|nr:glycerol kinase GlpK [Clostridiales bacterium]
MKQYVMALDQGTTSSRCIIYDRQGKICSVGQKEIKQYYPQSGWVEHDPLEIWNSQINVAKQAMEKINITADNIAAIGITNQRETTVVWDKRSGKPIYNAIVWQCRRTAYMIDELTKDGYGEYIKKTTGLIPDAYFSASKLKWILDRIDGAREEASRGNLLFGTIETWLIWNLTNGKSFVTDYSNASRTMLFDIYKLNWDKELLKKNDIPEEMLPTPRPSSCIYGYTDKEIFGGEIPVSGAAGDQQAALFGQCCFEAGDTKITYGTGGFLLSNQGKNPIISNSGLITTIAASKPNEVKYALEGSIFMAGASVQWLRDELRLINSAEETESLALSVNDTNGVYLVPAFTGIGAPYWNPYGRGTIVGLTRGTKKEHFTRAVLESIAYRVNDVIMAMENDTGKKINKLKADGGASSNRFLMQFQSDISNIGVYRPKSIETTSLGAAYLAGLAVGYWDNTEELKENSKLYDVFNPQMEGDKAANLLKGWNKAINTAIHWSENK